MQTLTVFLLAAAAVCVFARSTKYGTALENNEVPPYDGPSKQPISAYYKKPAVSLNSIEVGQQMGKKYPDYVNVEEKAHEQIPVDERGNVWSSNNMHTSPKPYLEIPWLDEKLYKEVKSNADLSSTLMRAIIDNSYKKYGFRIKLDNPIIAQPDIEDMYDMDDELDDIATSLESWDSNTDDNMTETKTDEKRKQEMDPRQTRQNSVSKTKTLVAEDLNSLRTGLNEKPKPQYTLYTQSQDSANTMYGAALITIFVAAATMAVFAFAYGWYTLVKRTKAAADVEYPAYGVTGPSSEGSGDRRLAHSAHIYHYQHQKQQIIAMEKLNEADEAGQILSPQKLLSSQSNGLETSHGSISDPDSEEERAEGDYTVYECPGFATTGDMEVKNPMFTEDPTPATPGKCELVHPQPKE